MPDISEELLSVIPGHGSLQWSMLVVKFDSKDNTILNKLSMVSLVKGAVGLW